ncbi:MAG: hypothetical protein LBG07_09145 [Treponema sp.]|jgi:hypothetical protein|nr:hypothetical protein [Treponema sp.]
MNPRPLLVLLADITRNHDGKRLSLSRRQCGGRPGDYPYYGPEGIIAWIDSYAYEGEYFLIAAPSAGGPWAVPVNGRFSANSRVHVLSCEPGLDPAFLCALLNTLPCPRPPLPPLIDLKKLETLEFSIPGLEVQRRILRALSSMEAKAALLRDQNRVLSGMVHSLFDRFFIIGPESPRPLGDFAGYRPADDSPAGSAGEKPRGAVFYNLFLYPREDLHPFFIEALIKNPEFLSYAKGCGEAGKRRINGERLMAFELSGFGAAAGRRNAPGVCREFNYFAEAAEKKLAANHAELGVLRKLRQSLIPSPRSLFFPQKNTPEIPAEISGMEISMPGWTPPGSRAEQ